MHVQGLKQKFVANMCVVARQRGADLVVTAQPAQTQGRYVFGSLHIRGGLIFNFTVNASFRKYGVGKRLFRAAINRSDLPTRLRLYAKAESGGLTQNQLEGFYESFGFKATGVVTHHGKQMQLDRTITANAAVYA
jgi:ribosomal protein S18 acetylase RimI-like enzyme